MSVTFVNKGRNIKQAKGNQLKQGDYIVGPSCGLPILITKPASQSSSGYVDGVRLDNGVGVRLEHERHYTLLKVNVEFTAEEAI